MNAKNPKKLVLSKETVRTLDSEEMQGVAGGYFVLTYALTPPINLRLFATRNTCIACLTTGVKIGAVQG